MGDLDPVFAKISQRPPVALGAPTPAPILAPPLLSRPDWLRNPTSPACRRSCESCRSGWPRTRSRATPTASNGEESDAAEFIIHPLEVASLLYVSGHRDDVVAAGILHDTIENSAATCRDIEVRFGDQITRIVAAMTEDPAIESFDERKARGRHHPM